jgi:hypothetical protein
MQTYNISQPTITLTLKQLTKLCPMATDNANAAPPPEHSCPHIVKNNQPRLRVYPRWFLLKRHNLVPVALKTRDVGFAAFNKMRSAGKMRVVPQRAEKVVRSINNLIWMDG